MHEAYGNTVIVFRLSHWIAGICVLAVGRPHGPHQNHQDHHRCCSRRRCIERHLHCHLHQEEAGRQRGAGRVLDSRWPIFSDSVLVLYLLLWPQVPFFSNPCCHDGWVQPELRPSPQRFCDVSAARIQPVIHISTAASAIRPRVLPTAATPSLPPRCSTSAIPTSTNRFILPVKCRLVVGIVPALPRRIIYSLQQLLGSFASR